MFFVRRTIEIGKIADNPTNVLAPSSTAVSSRLPAGLSFSIGVIKEFGLRRRKCSEALPIDALNILCRER